MTAQGFFCTGEGLPAQLNIMEENIKRAVGPDATSPGHMLDYTSLSETLRQLPKRSNQLAKLGPCGSDYFSVPAKIPDVTREQERHFLVMCIIKLKEFTVYSIPTFICRLSTSQEN